MNIFLQKRNLLFSLGAVVFFFFNLFISYKCISSGLNLYKSILLHITGDAILFFIAIIAFVQFQIFKDKTYLHYVFYILLNALYSTILFSYEIKNTWLIPNWFLIIRPYLTLPALVLSYFFYVNFAINFLTLKTKDSLSYKWLKRFSNIYLLLFLGCFLSNIFSPTIQSYLRTTILILCMPLGLISIVLVYTRVKNTIAKIFCIGSLLFTVGSILGFLYSGESIPFIVNTFPFNKWIFYTGSGALLEIIMFSSSFAYRDKTLANEEKKAQILLLNEINENKLKELKMQQIRNEISINLHDEIGSTLTSINILSTISEQAMDKEPIQAKEMIQKIAKQSKTIQQNMSDIVWSIRPENEKIENLLVRMREFCGQTLEPLQIKYTISADEDILYKILSMDMRKELLLIFKEAISNTVKHSGANEVIVYFTKNEKELIFTIADNGTWKGANSGTGTKSMQQRAAAIAATLSILNTESGTKVITTVPIP